MDINEELMNFVHKHCETEGQRNFIDYIRRSKTDFLNLIAMSKVHGIILDLVTQFLDELPFAVASKYVGEHNNGMVHTPIIFTKNVHFLKSIIKYIDNVDVGEYYQCTSLMLACSGAEFDLDRIKILLDHGAQVNKLSANGKTPLICLCQSINDENVEEKLEALTLLIFLGADVLVTTHENMKAYDYIVNKNLLPERLLQLLQGHIKLNNIKRAQKS